MSKSLDRKIEKAFDTGTLNSDSVHLNEEQADKFIDYIKDESALLPNSRVVKMKKPIKEIERVMTDEHFLKPGSHDKALDKDTKFTSSRKELKAEVVRWLVKLTDDELNDNIEWEAFEQHLMQMIAKKIANELDIASYKGRKVATPNASEWILGLFNGFKYQAENAWKVVDATVDFADRNISKTKLKKTMRMLKNQYRQNANWFMNIDSYIDFQDLYNTTDKKGTDIRTSLYGKNIIEIPLMDVEELVVDGVASSTASGTSSAGQKDLTVADGTDFASGQFIVVAKDTEYERTYEVDSVSTNTLTLTSDLLYDVNDGEAVESGTKDGNSVLFSNSQNLLYGILNRISIEPERVAGVGYNFHYKGRMAIDIENTDAISILTNLKATE